MQSTRSREWTPWILWLFLLLGTAAFLAYALYQDDAQVYLIGDLTHGHHQIEVSCGSCHSAPFGGGAVLQDACVKCHAEDLRMARDAHPKSKFTDPRNAERVAELDARICISCHVEHHPERVREMGVTVPQDFCSACHKDIAEDRPSHRGLEFASCATGGCHNFHDNRGLYEDFLLAHRDEPELLNEPRVAEREAGRLVRIIQEYPLAALQATDADMPTTLVFDPQHLLDWVATAHAQAGVNCLDCHGAADNSSPAWRERPEQNACASCHSVEAEGFGAGLHGMREAAGLTPMRPELAQLPMRAQAHGRELSCTSCHGAHRFDVRHAAAEACLDCHDDSHSRSYAQSPHARLWHEERERRAPAGSGVSCATCHLPRSQHRIDGQSVILANHNQNTNLRPNEKMLRSVCLNCHGLAFAIDALADAALVGNNFKGLPAEHVPSIDWAVRRETAAAESDSSTQPGEYTDE